MAIEIKYKDKRVTLENGQRATLYTKDTYMEDDVLVEATGLELVIPVDELPTENIDLTALYLYDGAYYKYEKITVLTDIIAVDDGVARSVKECAPLFGWEVSFNTISIKTRDDALLSDGESVFHFYYVKNDASVFLYFGEWVDISEANLGVYNGEISDMSEATANGLYALMENTSDWTKYLAPVGTLEIFENGTYDINDKKTVVVDMPDAAVCGVWQFNTAPDCAALRSILEQTVNFTTADKSFCGLGYGNYNEGDAMRYIYENGEAEWVYYSSNIYFEPQSWSDETYRTIDFGTNPQLVSSIFKEWLTANATQVEKLPKLQDKNIAENGEYTADEGYDGLGKVIVNVPGEVLEEYDGTITIQ